MNYKFRNLVFEGGGVKGIAYGGALEVLQNMNVLPGIKRVAGTSAGAITAALLALNYTSAEVGQIIAGTDFKSFEDGQGWLFSDVRRLLSKYGWYRGEKFREWMGERIKVKTGKPDITFAEMKQMAAERGYRDLYVIATNLSLQRAEIYSAEHTPQMIVRDAVRMSMGIPLYFESFLNSDNIMVDGGVSWNYAINLFDYKKYIENPANGKSVDYADDPEYIFNYETLGFRLDSKSVIEYAKHNWALEPMKIKGMKQYAGALINFMMEMANKSHLKKNDWNRTIFIDTLDVKTTEFKLPSEKIQGLITSGTQCVNEYFTWRNKEPEWNVVPS